MKITGKVTNKTENASGHSQVRISAEAAIGKEPPQQVEVILSTPSADVVGAFKIGQSVSFEL